MKKKFIIPLLLIIAITITSFAGCKKEETESTEINIDEIMENLDEGGFYVVHNNYPTQIYFGNATFEQGEITTVSVYDSQINSEEKDYSTNRVMWYQDDYENIPTLYKGDSLIFYSNEVLTGEVNFERFEDMGYSLGLCNLYPSSVQGKYQIETEVDKKTAYPESDAAIINQFSQETIILDKISGKQLGAGNISRCGSIVGLEKDSIYKCDFYGGTVLFQSDLTANTRIFASYQQYTSTDCEFLSSTVIKWNIPSWFHSGYYCVNGQGMFRYVNSQEEFTEDMDMNIANDTPEYLLDSDEESTEEKSSDSFSYVLTDSQLGERVLTITIDNPKDATETIVPVEAVFSSTDLNDSNIIKAVEKDNTIIINYTAKKPGEYKCGLTNLCGRHLVYSDAPTTGGNNDNE